MAPEGAGALDRLPFSVLQSIVSRLDLDSICTASASCKLLRSAVDQELPFLSTLQFEDILVDNRILERVLSNNVSLTYIKLNCGHLDDKAIEYIAKPQVNELHLYNCQRFTGRLLEQIGLTCRNLRSLSLDPCPERSSTLASLVDCQHLESLSLTLTGDSSIAKELSELQLPLLKTLEIGCISEKTAVDILKSRIYRNLRRLSLVLFQLSDLIVQEISENLHSLVELELQDEPNVNPRQGSDLTNGGIQRLGCLSKLTWLSLLRRNLSFQRVNDLGIFMVIERLENLESLRLGGFSRITDASCSTILQSCSKLHTFELVHTNQLTDLAFHNLSLTPLELKTVNLASNSYVSDDTIRKLVLCKTIEVLNLKGCNSIGDSGMRALVGLKQLRHLFLDGSDVSDFGLFAIAGMKLESLSVRSCSRITDDGIVALFDGDTGKGLQSLDISSIPKLTDESILAVARNQMVLSELWLRDCYLIGDTSVMALASMRRYGGTLRLLDLWNCKKISRNSIIWFRKPYFRRLRRLGLPQVLTQSIRLVTEERPYMAVHWRGSELGRRDEEHEWLRNTRRFEEEDELERWLGDYD